MATRNFIKVIVGGYEQYSSSLSRNRFGGALWLRLKTASETLRKQEAGSRSRLKVASSSRVSHLRPLKEYEPTLRPQMGFALFGLTALAFLLNFAKTVARKLSQQTTLQRGRKHRSLAREAK